MGLGIGRALWSFSMHHLSYSEARVWFWMCVFVHSLQTAFLWVFCGWLVQINIVNRLCVCTNAAYVDSQLSLFERQLLFFLVHDTFVLLLSQCKCMVRCCRCCEFMFVRHNQCPPALTSENLLGLLSPSLTRRLDSPLPLLPLAPRSVALKASLSV